LPADYLIFAIFHIDTYDFAATIFLFSPFAMIRFTHYHFQPPPLRDFAAAMHFDISLRRFRFRFCGFSRLFSAHSRFQPLR